MKHAHKNRKQRDHNLGLRFSQYSKWNPMDYYVSEVSWNANVITNSHAWALRRTQPFPLNGDGVALSIGVWTWDAFFRLCPSGAWNGYREMEPTGSSGGIIGPLHRLTHGGDTVRNHYSTFLATASDAAITAITACAILIPNSCNMRRVAHYTR